MASEVHLWCITILLNRSWYFCGVVVVRNGRVDESAADRRGFAAAEVEVAGFAIRHDITTTTRLDLFETTSSFKCRLLRCSSNECGVYSVSCWRVLALCSKLCLTTSSHASCGAAGCTKAINHDTTKARRFYMFERIGRSMYDPLPYFSAGRDQPTAAPHRVMASAQCAILAHM